MSGNGRSERGQAGTVLFCHYSPGPVTMMRVVALALAAALAEDDDVCGYLLLHDNVCVSRHTAGMVYLQNRALYTFSHEADVAFTFYTFLLFLFFYIYLFYIYLFSFSLF